MFEVVILCLITNNIIFFVFNILLNSFNNMLKTTVIIKEIYGIIKFKDQNEK